MVTADVTIAGVLWRLLSGDRQGNMAARENMAISAPISESVLIEQANGRTLMLFDGLCGLCNRAVQWVVRRDHADRFRFVPQQSPLAAVIMSRHGIDHEAMLKNNSVYLVLDFGSAHERLLAQSDVTVNLLLLLGGRFHVLGYLLRAVPTFLRNAAYGLFARNRYRLTGRYEVCPLPTEAERKKFLG
jgi:predicted DCC family thiol-disulfide oxidoreductase YuxK